MKRASRRAFWLLLCLYTAWQLVHRREAVPDLLPPNDGDLYKLGSFAFVTSMWVAIYWQASRQCHDSDNSLYQMPGDPASVTVCSAAEHQGEQKQLSGRGACSPRRC
jgi:hypothetical protein